MSETEFEEQPSQSGANLQNGQSGEHLEEIDLDPVNQPGELSGGTEHHQQLQPPTIHGQRGQDVLPIGHLRLRWQKPQFSRLRKQPIIILPEPGHVHRQKHQQIS